MLANGAKLSPIMKVKIKSKYEIMKYVAVIRSTTAGKVSSMYASSAQFILEIVKLLAILRRLALEVDRDSLSRR